MFKRRNVDVSRGRWSFPRSCLGSETRRVSLFVLTLPGPRRPVGTPSPDTIDQTSHYGRPENPFIIEIGPIKHLGETLITRTLTCKRRRP